MSEIDVELPARPGFWLQPVVPYTDEPLAPAIPTEVTWDGFVFHTSENTMEWRDLERDSEDGVVVLLYRYDEDGRRADIAREWFGSPVYKGDTFRLVHPLRIELRWG